MPLSYTLIVRPDEELVLRDLACGLDARKVAHPCAFIWHPLAGAVPQLHAGAIVHQVEPLAAEGEEILYIVIPPCCHHRAAPGQHGEPKQAELPLLFRREGRILQQF
eukprot:6460105-Amphidinium_carterae.1